MAELSDVLGGDPWVTGDGRTLLFAADAPDFKSQLKLAEYVFDFGLGADGTLWVLGSLLDDEAWGLFATTDMATAAQAPSSISRYQPTTGRVITFTIANAVE